MYYSHSWKWRRIWRYCEKDLPINLKTVINPVNPYAVSKVAQDLIAKVYYDSYGLNVVRTRALIMKVQDVRMCLAYPGMHIKSAKSRQDCRKKDGYRSQI